MPSVQRQLDSVNGQSVDWRDTHEIHFLQAPLVPARDYPARRMALSPLHVEAFERITNLAKTLTLKAARAVNSGRALDASQSFDEMAEAWQIARDTTIAALDTRAKPR